MNLETIDKKRVRQAFSRQASVYEENALLQRNVAERLISMIPSRLTSHVSRPTVLDIGIGTGFATKGFSSRFPDSTLFGCDPARGMLSEAVKTGATLTEADAEYLPFRDSSFDIVISSLAFQWTSLNSSVSEAFRVLKPGGALYFSTFEEKTLRELADSYSSALLNIGNNGSGDTISFYPSCEISEFMISAGFKDIKMKEDTRKCVYPSPEALLRSLKAIGAGNPSGSFHPSRTILTETFRIYRERYSSTDDIYATFETIYVSGVKG